MTKSGYKFFGIRYIFSLDFTYIYLSLSLCHFKNNLILVTALQIDITPKQYFLYLQSYNKVPVDHFICKKKKNAHASDFATGQQRRATTVVVQLQLTSFHILKVLIVRGLYYYTQSPPFFFFFQSMCCTYTKEVNLDCMGR